MRIVASRAEKIWKFFARKSEKEEFFAESFKTVNSQVTNSIAFNKLQNPFFGSPLATMENRVEAAAEASSACSTISSNNFASKFNYVKRLIRKWSKHKTPKMLDFNKLQRIKSVLTYKNHKHLVGSTESYSLHPHKILIFVVTQKQVLAEKSAYG